MGTGRVINDGLVDVMKAAISGSLTNANILDSKDFSQKHKNIFSISSCTYIINNSLLI